MSFLMGSTSCRYCRIPRHHFGSVASARMVQRRLCWMVLMQKGCVRRNLPPFSYSVVHWSAAKKRQWTCSTMLRKSVLPMCHCSPSRDQYAYHQDKNKIPECRQGIDIPSCSAPEDNKPQQVPGINHGDMHPQAAQNNTQQDATHDLADSTDRMSFPEPSRWGTYIGHSCTEDARCPDISIGHWSKWLPHCMH